MAGLRLTRQANRSYYADAALLVVCVIWGSTFIVVKDALYGSGPFTFLALRFGLALVVLLPLCHRRLLKLGRHEMAAGALIGVFLLAGYALQTLGLQSTSASKAGFITGLSVVFVPLLARLLLGQSPGQGAAMGVALALVGLLLLSWPAGDQPLWPAQRGDLLVLGCAVAFAQHIIAIGHFAPRMDTLNLSVVQIGVVALGAACAMVLMEPWPPGVAGGAFLAAAYTGLVGTALVLAVQNAAQAFTTPTHTALIFALEPVFAAAFAYALGGEQLGTLALVGGGLMLAGMVLAEVRR